jgi:hypothetical protein
MRKSGWRSFTLLLRGAGDDAGEPVASGIHSRGGRGVLPWIEIATYRPDRLPRPLPESPDVVLFRALHDILEPGSHIMLWYEDEPGRPTDRALLKGVPPLLTPFGRVLFEAGFLSGRDFHLPEGGHEGGRKLWAERPPGERTARAWRARGLREAAGYFCRPIRGNILDIEREGREAALGLFRSSRPAPDRADLCDALGDALASTLAAGPGELDVWPETVAALLGGLDATLAGPVEEALVARVAGD